MNKLYHREVYWLDSFDSQSLTLIRSIERLSNHLYDHIENSNKPRYDISVEHLYNIVQGLYSQDIHPFEVEVDCNNKVVKTVIRTSYDDNRDISIVIRYGYIVSAWLNNKCDNHLALDRSKYEVSLDNVNK